MPFQVYIDLSNEVLVPRIIDPALHPIWMICWVRAVDAQETSKVESGPTKTDAEDSHWSEAREHLQVDNNSVNLDRFPHLLGYQMVCA